MDDTNNIPAAGSEDDMDQNQGQNINPPPEDMPLPEMRSSARNGATTNSADDQMDERLERLGGEPAPVITPEEFARLQKAGQVHIDARGRVKTTGRSGADAGVSLNKRRAWYHTAR